MPKDTTPSDYLNDFLGRVKAARESMGWTLKQMAKALDIPEARYAKYETRTPLPHDLIERFALITGLSVEYLITGESSKRPKPPKPSKPERERA